MAKETNKITVRQADRRGTSGYFIVGIKTAEEWKNYLEEHGPLLDSDDRHAINEALRRDRESN